MTVTSDSVLGSMFAIKCEASQALHTRHISLCECATLMWVVHPLTHLHVALTDIVLSELDMHNKNKVTTSLDITSALHAIHIVQHKLVCTMLKTACMPAVTVIGHRE